MGLAALSVIGAESEFYQRMKMLLKTREQIGDALFGCSPGRSWSDGGRHHRCLGAVVRRTTAGGSGRVATEHGEGAACSEAGIAINCELRSPT